MAHRRLRSLGPLTDEEALAFARSFSWPGGSIRPTQTTAEVLWLLERVRRLGARVVVEIGTDEGGTLFLWSRAAAPDALLVAVDTRPLGPLGRHSPYALVRRGFAKASQRVELLLPRDSHDPATVAELRRRIVDRPIDFLFIDGDHSYQGVKKDFELYAPLVRPGGIIAFHDINSTIAPGVQRFWQEIAAAHETAECVVSEFGIGLLEP
jgi:predicted O-methyltransferase YrrM